MSKSAFILRMEKVKLEELKRKAKKKDISLNAWMKTKLFEDVKSDEQ